MGEIKKQGIFNMYKVAMKVSVSKYLNSAPFYDYETARNYKKFLDTIFQGCEEFKIVGYCERCGKQQEKLHRNGLCESCFQDLQKQSPCYQCKENTENGSCADCWVTRYIMGVKK